MTLEKKLWDEVAFKVLKRVELAVSAKRVVVVAFRAKSVVALATDEKSDVVVAFVKRPIVERRTSEKEKVEVAWVAINCDVEAKFAKKFVVVAETAENFTAVVEPLAVSTAKTEVEAAFNIWKARPFTGVWKVVVAP